MRAYTLNHLSDAALLRDLAALIVRDRATTADLLAHIAEVDARRLYVPAGYSSMFAYCVAELRLSEDAAYKRIQAARAARSFPALLDALANGRLHLTAVCLLAPHLTPESAGSLMADAAHKGNDEIRRLLALRFPGAAARVVAATVRPVALRPNPPASARHVGTGLLELAPEQVAGEIPELAPEQVAGDRPPGAESPAPVQVDPARRVELFRLQVTIGRSTHDKLRHAQGLLGHAVPSGDLAQVLDRALDALIDRCEKRKFAAVEKPRSRSRPRTGARTRHVPAEVRRAVRARDEGRCTFVGTTGRRCGARTLLEFDHVDPVARGGQASVERMRLRCRAHNQYEAERTFGAGFMKKKRTVARLRAGEARRPAVSLEPAFRPAPPGDASGSTGGTRGSPG